MSLDQFCPKTSTGRAAGMLLFCFPAQGASAQESVVSACSGVSLPRSVVTDIMSPVINGVVAPVEGVVNPLLAVLDLLTLGVLPAPLSINATGLLNTAASGAPITLSVLNKDGVIVGPSDECIATSDAITLEGEKGLSIGGNRITGLGANGLEADAGEIDSIALGNGAITDVNAAAAIAIGRSATVENGAIGGVAVGHDATVGNGAIDSVAIGSRASATAPNSVALGADSTVGTAPVGSAFNPGIDPIAGATSAGEVSLGNSTDKRRLTNLAAGTNDTDAANIGQLKAVNNKIDAMDDWGIRYDTVSRETVSLQGADGTRITNVSDGEISSTSSDAINGSQLHGASQNVADLLGGGANVDPQGAVIGPTYQIQGGSHMTIYDAFTAVDGSMTDINSRVNNIDTTVGEVTDRAVRYDGAEGAAKATITLAGAAGSAITNLRPGLVNATSTDAVNGSQLHATNAALSVLSNSAVQYESDVHGNKTNIVALVGGDPSTPVVIKNVAAGIDAEDAVNVVQLETGMSLTLNEAKHYADSLAFDDGSDNRGYTDQVALTTLNKANNYTDFRVGQLEMQIDEVRTEARQAAAIGLASSSIRFADSPGSLSVGVGGGFWRGASAAAIGAGYTSMSGAVRANFSAATAGGNFGGGAGISLTFN